jgi:iron complex outermembrane recepter protein
MFKPALFVGVATAALLIPSAMASAQTAGAADAVEATDSGEIIVTAQKRSERLIDVPMSISAVQGDTLVKVGILQTTNLQQTTPGLVTVNTGFGFVPVIRGINSSGTSPGDASNVALYLDDVSVGAPIAGFFDLSDIERVEVLKGPQGTLFGRNATGGAIRIFTRRPSFEAKATVGADYGFRYNELRLNAYATGPLSDKVAASVSGTIRKGDGYIKGIGPNEGKDYGGADNYLVRGKLLFQPSENFEAILAADKWQQQNDSVFISMINNGANPFPGTAAIPNGPYTYASSTQPKADLKGWGGSLDAKWDSDDLTIRSITGYRKVQVRSQSDTDRTSLSTSWNAISQYEKAFSQEINISGATDKPLTWMVGGYYFNAKAGNPYFRQGTGDGRGLTGLPATGGTIASNFTNRMKTEAFAGFADATYNLTDALHLTGGIRYNSERKDFHYQTLVPATGATLDTHKRWNSTTFRAIARYDFNNNANVYASVSNGFKSGVYNAYSPLNNPVDPEKVMAYEVGAKARLAGFTFTAAAYAYEYKDIQLSAYVNVNGNLLISLSNAANARMRGLEFTMDGPLGGGFSVNAGLGWEPTRKYRNYTGAQVVVPIVGVAPDVQPNKRVIAPYDASGSKMVRAPETTANIRLNYRADIAGGQLDANVNGSYTSSFFWQPGNFSKEPSYFLVGGRIGWKDTGRGVTYSVFGNNLTNKLYRTDFVANTRGDDSIKLPPRREIGVGVSIDF